MAIPPISQELLDQALLTHYGQSGTEVHSFKMLHLDEVSMTVAWQEQAGPRVEAKFLLKESGLELLWSEVH